jgi:hypothetical protein
VLGLTAGALVSTRTAILDHLSIAGDSKASCPGPRAPVARLGSPRPSWSSILIEGAGLGGIWPESRLAGVIYLGAFEYDRFRTGTFAHPLR